MRIDRIALAAALATSLAATPALAQLYKCKGPDGKTVYSDSKCEGSEKGALKVTPMATTPSEREKAMAEEAAQKAKDAAEKSQATLPAKPGKPQEPTAPATATRSTGYSLTSDDRERLRSLEQVGGSIAASNEQKSAARLEADYIRSGRDSRLDSDQRSRRDSLRMDLGSPDAKKRKQAYQEFRSLYY